MGYSYAYDHDNRLVCVYTDVNADGDYDAGTDTGHGLYDYDALGRRIRTILGGVTTKYYCDGQRVLLETDNAGFVYGNCEKTVSGISAVPLTNTDHAITSIITKTYGRS